MNLEKLTIEGYKSIGKIEIVKPNPFTVFVGPNASGKSNIFEAIEFLELCQYLWHGQAARLFGNPSDIFNQLLSENKSYIKFLLDFGDIKPTLDIQTSVIDGILTIGDADSKDLPIPKPYPDEISLRLHTENRGYIEGYEDLLNNTNYLHFRNFSKLFVGRGKVRLSFQDDSRLNTDASNLEKVLKRILKDENKREEIYEILQLLIPGFEKVEIVSSELSGTDTLIVHETHLKKPLTKEFISDGTYNLIAIMAALYQSDTPQFLCIEEPENGVNPFVVKELVSIFRNRCKEQGHYIWLNTHSQSLVNELKGGEMIIVDKKNGLTGIKQIEEKDMFGLPMDEALFTNVLGGGTPW